jgi:hypothetical protein
MLCLVCGRYTYKLNVCIIHIWSFIHVYIHIYSERENRIVLVSLSEGLRGTVEGKKMLENENHWNSPYIYECNIMYYIVSCQILGEHGDGERVSNGEVNLIEAWYVQGWSTKEKPLGTSIYT